MIGYSQVYLHAIRLKFQTVNATVLVKSWIPLHIVSEWNKNVHKFLPLIELRKRWQVSIVTGFIHCFLNIDLQLIFNLK